MSIRLALPLDAAWHELYKRSKERAGNAASCVTVLHAIQWVVVCSAWPVLSCVCPASFAYT